MDEATYATHAETALRALLKRLDALDADEVDSDRAGDVVTIAFRSGRKCIVNTQRPTRQLWLAHGTQAWHFAYDVGRSQWLDDKGHGDELFAMIDTIVQKETSAQPA
jgi:CyaY protein